MTNDTSTSTPIAHRGERYIVSVDERCPVIGEPCEGLRVYGPGRLAIRSASAPAWAPTLVDLVPEGGNGVYLCAGFDAAPWALSVVSRWLIREEYREDTGRITDAGRAALYAAPRF